MWRRRPLFIIVLLAVVGLAGGWLAFSWAAAPPDAGGGAPEAVQGTGALDGLTFVADLGPMGKPPDLVDRLVFEDGTFLSIECHKTCDFPARPYFTRRVGDTVEFISETRCPYKDATIVWRGTIDGDTIRGVFTWTIDRWYWTIEKDFWFEGELATKTPDVATTP